MASFFWRCDLVYSAPMELQTQIDEMKRSLNRQKLLNIALASVIVAGVGVAAIQPAGDATFDTITCKAWKVVDNESKLRISAGTDADGYAGVQWFDKDGKSRPCPTTTRLLPHRRKSSQQSGTCRPCQTTARLLSHRRESPH